MTKCATIIKTSIAILLLCSLAGCSIVSFTYNHADWYLIRQTNKYIPLTEQQEVELKASLQAMHAQHKQQELPKYIDFLNNTKIASQNQLTADELETLRKEFVTLYVNLIDLFIEPLAPLLSNLSDEQIQFFSEQLEEYNKEQAQELGLQSEADMLKKRIKRLEKSHKFWSKNITEQQQAYLEETAKNLSGTEPYWHAYHVKKQQQLLIMLKEHAPPKAIEAYIKSWLIDTEGKNIKHAELADIEQKNMFQLTLDTANGLNAKQKIYMHNKLDEYTKTLQQLLPKNLQVAKQ